MVHRLPVFELDSWFGHILLSCGRKKQQRRGILFDGGEMTTAADAVRGHDKEATGEIRVLQVQPKNLQHTCTCIYVHIVHTYYLCMHFPKV